MADFTKHFRMTEQDAITYVRQMLTIFDPGEKLVCQEIGDGNINYVFRVENSESGKSIIIKHADVVTRSSGGAVSVDRNRIEADVLKKQGEMAPGLVPEVFFYDPVMCCLVMQDLRDYVNMRYALIAHQTFSTFAEDISGFMAQTLLRTSDAVLNPSKKKELVGRFINPSLCDITERLVYTDPYTNAGGGNVLFEANKGFLVRELYEDEALRLEAAKLKNQFESKAQALIHGDLHTGSIFVKEGSTMVLDPEFAFFGPIGYDVGNLIANLIFGWVSARTTMAEGEEKRHFLIWMEDTIRRSIDLFVHKALHILKTEVSDPLFMMPGYAEWYVDDILTDTAGVAGLELNRRVIGIAKVKDIVGIQDPVQRVWAERVCVLAAKGFIMGRTSGYRQGENYIRGLYQAVDYVNRTHGKG